MPSIALARSVLMLVSGMLILVAMGYQESRLVQSARSGAGAVGVMQLIPSTGAQMRVGDIRQLEDNIHAWAK